MIIRVNDNVTLTTPAPCNLMSNVPFTLPRPPATGYKRVVRAKYCPGVGWWMRFDSGGSWRLQRQAKP